MINYDDEYFGIPITYIVLVERRSLINSLPEIIASPGVVGLRRSDPSEIYILAKNKYFWTGEIQQKLRNMDIEVLELLLITEI